MAGHSKWSDIRPQAVAELGGEQVVAVARQRQQAYIDAYRLAERRTALGLTQADVAERMGVTKGRVSQIERGEVSTVDVIARYVQAIGGEAADLRRLRRRPLRPTRNRHRRLIDDRSPVVVGTSVRANGHRGIRAACASARDPGEADERFEDAQ